VTSFTLLVGREAIAVPLPQMAGAEIVDAHKTTANATLSNLTTADAFLELEATLL
jgi:hypothetical protein